MERIIVNMYRKFKLFPVLFTMGILSSMGGFAQTSSSNWCDPYLNGDTRNSSCTGGSTNPNSSNEAPKIIPYTYSSAYSPGFDASAYESYAYAYRPNQYRIDLLPFRLLKPLNYDPSKSYPLIIMLHGRGERGFDNNFHLKWGGGPHLTARNNGSYDGFVLFPQEPYGQWTNTPNFEPWQPSDALQNMWITVDSLKLKYSIDPDRVVIHGLSSGGTGTLASLYHRNDLFAAALPMSADCGSTYPSQMGILSPMPIWWFQGADDTNPLPYFSLQATTALKDSGGVDPAKTRYTEYEDVGHETWSPAYLEPDFFPYIMRANKRKIYLMGNNPICDGGKTMLGMSPGYANYQWFKDGVLILGATQNKLRNITNGGKFYCRIQRNGSSAYFYSDTLTILGAPTIVHNQSLILPSPSATSVTLSTAESYTQYEWSNNATSSSITTSTTGDYRVKGYKNGCWTAYSPYVHVQSGTLGTPAPIAPTNLLATANTPISATLSWTDNAIDELNYEIYRSNQSGGPYSLISIISANTTSYLDGSLLPNTDYYYQVRVVNAQAAASSNEAHVKTFILDLPAPSIPTSIVLKALSEEGLTLNWTAPASSYPIRRYLIYNNNVFLGYSTTPTFFYSSVAPGNNYSFSVKAEDMNGNISGASETKFWAYDGKGLFASKYSISPTALKLPDYLSMTPNAQGWVASPILNASNTGTTVNNKLTGTDLVTENPKNYFGMYLRGYIYINPNNLGVYTFYTNSDDGSNLYISGTKVVKNDSLHGGVTRWGTYNFTQGGWHAIRVDYFEKDGGQGMDVHYSGPSNNPAKTLLTESILATTSAGVVAVPNTNPSSTSRSLNLSDASTSDQIKTLVSVSLGGLANVTYYELYRIKSPSNPAANATWLKIATINKVGTASTDNFTFLDKEESPAVSLQANTRYYYALKILNANSAVSYFFTSGYRSYTTPNTVITIPNAPSTLVVAKTFNAVKTGTFVDNANNETGFELWRSIESNANYTLINNLPKDATTFTDNSALANTNYFYKIRSYNQAGFSNFSNVDNTTPSITTYYSQSTGNLNELSTWGANPDGSGPPPTNFTSANLTFIYSNRTDETILNAPWTVNGSNSKIIVEAGKILTVGAGVTLNGNLEVMANAEVKFESQSVPTITSVDATSTLTFSNGSTIPDVNYGNVILETTGTKQLPPVLRIRGSLTLEGSTIIEGAPSNIELGGNLSYMDHSPILNNVSISFQGIAHEIQGNNGAVQFAKLQSVANAEIKVIGITQLTLGGSGQTGFYPGVNSILDLSSSDLSITGNGALNPLNTTSAIKCTSSSSLTITSSTTLESHLSLLPLFNTLKDISLNLTGPATFTLEESVLLTGTLKLTAGELKTNDKLALVSNVLGTARIAKVEPLATLNGKVQWQRLLGPDKKQTYMTVASPIAGQKIETLKQTITTINGFYGSGVPGVTTLNETTNGWTGVTDPNTIMLPGKGYRVFVRTADLTYPNNSAFVNITGLPTIGNGAGSNIAPFEIPLKKAGQGWNLIGNPYPCEIDWDAAAGWNKASVDNAFYVWDSKNGIYQSYVNGVGTGGLTSVINSGQAFMVKANVNNSVLSLTEDVKVTPSTSPKYYRLADVPSLMRMYMTNTDSISDEAIVRFNSEATSLFDSQYDALKYKGSSVNISTSAGQEELSINSFDYFDPSTKIPVNVQSTKGGVFSLSFTGSESFGKEIDLYLHDKEKSTYTNLRTTSTYAFSYPAAFTTKTRFELLLTNSASQVLDLGNERALMSEIQVFPNPASHSVTFHFGLSKGSEINIEVYNLSGQLVYTSNSKQGQGLHDTVWQFEKDKVTKGIYFYKVNVNGEIHDGKIVVQ